MTRKDNIADNTIVDNAIIEGPCMALIDLPPYINTMYDSVDYDKNSAIEGSTGVIRVNVHEGGIGLSTGLESKETGLDIGTLIMLNKEKALELADTIIKTVEGQKNG